MGKYSPLRDYLAGQGRDLVPMTFAEIERVLGDSLPASKRYPAWWSNNTFNNTMTAEWLAAGYQTESVDVAGEKLVFRKTSANKTKNGKAKVTEVTKGDTASGLHPMFGCMKGTLTIMPGVDLTAPSDESWDDFYTATEDQSAAQ